MNEFEIKHEGDHYVGYVNHKFACGGDTYNEVRKTLIDIVFSDLFEEEESYQGLFLFSRK